MKHVAWVKKLDDTNIEDALQSIFTVDKYYRYWLYKYF